MRLRDKVAVVTGAGAGFGRGIATILAGEGARVVVADIDEKAGKETAEILVKEGRQAVFAKADVSKAADVEAMIQTAVGEFDCIDVLVNNAAICRLSPLTDLTEEEWDRHLNINLKAVWLTSKYAIPHMVKQGGGAIVNIASLSGVKARPFMAAYCASKGGVIMLTQEMAVELAPAKIRVNSVSPVFGETPMGQGLLEQAAVHYQLGEAELAKEVVIQGIPLKRGATPEDIAHAVLYLASDEASLVTGINLTVDGGASA
jgi:3-oxoacyl-[acyl-carrier protein] reductase